jgi:hypothetical protein
MKKIAEIGFAMLGIYLIISAISYQSRSSFGLSYNAGFYDYMMVFATTR